MMLLWAYPDKVEDMAKEVELCQDRKHHEQAMRRRSSTSTASHMSIEPEEDYLPFPQSRNLSSRKAAVRRSSLLESLRQSFRRNSNDKDSIPGVMPSSQVSSLADDMIPDELDSHLSWANADEINAQTGIFNQKSISKLLESATKKDSSECEQAVHPSRRNSTMTSSLRHSTMTSQQPEPTPPRRKVQRRKSFTLGEKAPSLKHLFSKSSQEEQSIDVESELWDISGEKPALDISTKTGATDHYSVVTAGW